PRRRHADRQPELGRAALDGAGRRPARLPGGRARAAGGRHRRRAGARRGLPGGPGRGVRMSGAARDESRAEGRIANVSAAVLVGGASRRMGRDKAHLPLGGVALATRTARLPAAHFEDVLLVGRAPPADAPGRRVPDPDGPPCALRGLVGALTAARGERVLVVATDLPLLGPELLLALVAWPEADVVLPRVDGRMEPLCALWARERVLPLARAQLAAGRLA